MDVRISGQRFVEIFSLLTKKWICSVFLPLSPAVNDHPVLVTMQPASSPHPNMETSSFLPRFYVCRWGRNPNNNNQGEQIPFRSQVLTWSTTCRPKLAAPAVDVYSSVWLIPILLRNDEWNCSWRSLFLALISARSCWNATNSLAINSFRSFDLDLRYDAAFMFGRFIRCSELAGIWYPMIPSERTGYYRGKSQRCHSSTFDNAETTMTVGLIRRFIKQME